MTQSKIKRDLQSQLGQFFTPEQIAEEMVDTLSLSKNSTVLEPSSGDGAFLIPLIRKFMKIHTGSQKDKLAKILTENIFSIEIDQLSYKQSILNIEKEFGILPKIHNLIQGDFFDFDSKNKYFDFIVGNPPFGGTITPSKQDILDAKYGKRDGAKIKKETYSFFIVACVEMLSKSGQLKFICSDTFLTIPTMKGLREFLLNRGNIEVNKLDEFSDETTWPMVIMDFVLTGNKNNLIIDGKKLDRKVINLTGNKSWQIPDKFVKFFTGKKLGDFMVASSGMTIGRNEYFLRDINNNTIEEIYNFEFFNDPITLTKEKEKARLGILSNKQINSIKELEINGITQRNIRIVPRDKPKIINIPHKNYCLYNKASSDIIYAQPKYAIYWHNEGEAVLTFKKNGNWYLHGVGGRPFFKKEGLSWQLISSTLNTRYLPPNYILDSGAPCAFLHDNIDINELWFILGWTLTPLCTQILKKVINHTRNIQSKDFEKLPYPFWVNQSNKTKAINYIKAFVETAKTTGKKFDRTNDEMIKLFELYSD